MSMIPIHPSLAEAPMRLRGMPAGLALTPENASDLKFWADQLEQLQVRLDKLRSVPAVAIGIAIADCREVLQAQSL